jgi:hypothetical protein
MSPASESDTEKSPRVTEKPSRLKALGGKVLLILFGILVGALLAEIMLRVTGFSYPEFYQPDEVRGYALRPNKQGWYMKEGRAYVAINSAGFRDREHTLAKPEGTFRIAVLGDSYPEALQVEMQESFWFILEKKLQECGAFGGKQIEVLNFGVSGYGTAAELLTLRERVWDYSPDLVMLTFTTNNDISDNVRVLKKTNRVPYYVYQGEELKLDDSFKRTKTFRWRQSVVARAGRWFEDHLRLIQAIERAQLKLKIWMASRKAPAAGVMVQSNRPATGQSESELGIDNVVYREPNDAVWEDAWRVTEGLISAMRDEVRDHGAKFLVVTVSNGIQVYPNPAVREGFQRQLGVPDLFYPDRRIENLCRREGIDTLMLAPALQTYADQNRAFLHGFADNLGYGHWNQLGHRVAAEVIAKKMCE